MCDDIEREQKTHLMELLSEIEIDQDGERQFMEILYTASETGLIEGLDIDDAYRVIQIYELSKIIDTKNLNKIRM